MGQHSSSCSSSDQFWLCFSAPGSTAPQLGHEGCWGGDLEKSRTGPAGLLRSASGQGRWAQLGRDGKSCLSKSEGAAEQGGHGMLFGIRPPRAGGVHEGIEEEMQKKPPDPPSETRPGPSDKWEAARGAPHPAPPARPPPPTLHPQRAAGATLAGRRQRDYGRSPAAQRPSSEGGL